MTYLIKCHYVYLSVQPGLASSKRQQKLTLAEGEKEDEQKMFSLQKNISHLCVLRASARNQQVKNSSAGRFRGDAKIDNNCKIKYRPLHLMEKTNTNHLCVVCAFARNNTINHQTMMPVYTMRYLAKTVTSGKHVNNVLI